MVSWGYKMLLLLNAIGTFLVNLVLFSFIPFIWWFILILGIGYYFFYQLDLTTWFLSSDIDALVQSEAVAGNVYTGLGFAAVLPDFIENFCANGVCEELFFRGFIAKRLVSRIGMIKGLLIQAIIFVLEHNVLFLLADFNVGLAYHVITFIKIGIGALLMGVCNEKIFNGSIIPSIILHGLGNFISVIRNIF